MTRTFIRSLVNVSTHNGSALNTPRIQVKCPDNELLQRAFNLVQGWPWHVDVCGVVCSRLKAVVGGGGVLA